MHLLERLRHLFMLSYACLLLQMEHIKNLYALTVYPVHVCHAGPQLCLAVDASRDCHSNKQQVQMPAQHCALRSFWNVPESPEKGDKRQ
jgi:hypothetical protein